MKLFALITFISVLPTVSAVADDFRLPPPRFLSALAHKSLWATQYYVLKAVAATGLGSVPLRGNNGEKLGVSLTRVDWCHAAMEGTVWVGTESSVRWFNANGLVSKSQTYCSDVFPNVKDTTKDKLKRQAFESLDERDRFGLGLQHFRLVPYRSIAVPPGTIPYGTALYIPLLRGVRIPSLENRVFIHDGYVYAVDKGNEITGRHIDFFTGVNTSNPAPRVIASTPTKRFEAYIVKDRSILSYLRSIHQR